MVSIYSEQGGQDSVICFIPESGSISVEELPDNYLPVYVEELASIGLEVWLSALSFGASSILLIDDGSVPEMVLTPLQDQLEAAWAILSGLGYSESAIRYVRKDELENTLGATMPTIVPARYRVSNNKRQMAYFAIDHLYHQVEQAAEILAMPASSPFGRIRVNKDACTLCLACTSVCPANAIKAGGESPKLIFQELNCVQCGICARGCPEQAITLEPRLIADPEKRLASITLNEEQPFHCISCGKPFATHTVINTMLEKLQGHWMYQSERSRQRLKMCEDCRVVDAMQDPEAMEASMNGGQIGPNAH
jgi:ferredoxin